MKIEIKNLLSDREIKKFPLLIYLVIPMMITLWIYPFYLRVDLPLFGNSEIKVINDELDPPSLQSSLRKIVGSTFEIRWYDVCFQDYGSKIVRTYNNESITENQDWFIEFDSKNLSVKSGELACLQINKIDNLNGSLIKVENKAHMVITDSFPLNGTQPTTYEYLPRKKILVYAQPNLLGILPNMVISFFAIDTIIFLLNSLANIIFPPKKKMNKSDIK